VECFASAKDAVKQQRWSVAGSLSVQAGISAADAVLASWAGIRSRESDHDAAVGLLEQHVPTFGGTARRHLIGLLRRKNAVQYDDHIVTSVEAKQLVDHAERFLEWAQTSIKR
jgi:hypothetical protein